jgi:hypothetical protein
MLIYLFTLYFYLLFNTDVAFCKGDNNIAYVNNFDWSDPRVALAVLGLIVAAPVIKQYYDGFYFLSGNHNKDYYLERFNDLIQDSLDKNLIHEGGYLALYEKIHGAYKIIEGNREISEIVKLQKYDYLLFLLKHQYIPDVLNGLPIN